MNLRFVAITLLAVLLSACPSHEGTYSPSCIAYAGSNITLNDGQFVWEKFTDALVVDDEGNLVNQFPGYPMRGSYRVEGQAVYLEPDTGGSLQHMYLHRHRNNYYLLTADEFKLWEKTGNIADCTLQLVPETES